MAKAKTTSEITLQTLVTQIKEKKFYPIYFLYGEESFFIDQIENLLLTHVLQPHERDFNLSILYGNELTADKLAAIAKRYPMMSNYQLVVIREAQKMQKELDKLIPYFENPQNSTVLCFCYKERIEKFETKKYAKSIRQKGVCFESKRLYEYQVPQWIVEHAKTKGLNLSAKATQMIAIQMGNDLTAIDKELDKLALNCTEFSEITEKEISEYMGIDREFNLFEFLSAIAQKNRQKAYTILQYFVRNEKDFPTVVIVSNVFYFFDKVWRLHAHQVYDEKKAAEILGLPTFAAKDYVAAAKHYGKDKLGQILEAIFEAELSAKGVGTNDTVQGLIVQRLLHKILNT
ncbi:MAG: DNA polymerase III subunit delta [Bacteroidia bacterium]|nr:DNA polymerase III subunit delta [Bacteroidia bacterium]MDW8301992.1 DNA polymerase III subunit delta [Bacteroidia bacterium]